MKLSHLLIFGCLLLAACSSREESKPAVSEPATLKHLQQDKRINPEDQAGNFSVSLIPEPLIAAQPATAILTACREKTFFSWSVNGAIIAEANSSKLPSRYFKRGDEVDLQAGCGDKRAETFTKVENSPPVILAVKIAASQIISGADLQVVPQAEDVDGDSLNFSYHWTVNGEFLPEITGPILPGEYVQRDNLIAVQVTPEDQFNSGPTFEGIGFKVPNSPPQITSQPSQNFSAWTYEYQVVASDPDGDTLSYRLEHFPEGMSIAAGGLITWPLEKVPAGEYPIEIVVEDPDGLQSRQSYTLNLSAPE